MLTVVTGSVFSVAFVCLFVCPFFYATSQKPLQLGSLNWTRHLFCVFVHRLQWFQRVWNVYEVVLLQTVKLYTLESVSPWVVEWPVADDGRNIQEWTNQVLPQRFLLHIIITTTTIIIIIVGQHPHLLSVCHRNSRRVAWDSHRSDAGDCQAHHGCHWGHQGNRLPLPTPVHGSSTGECGLLPEHYDHWMKRRCSRLLCLVSIFPPTALC